MCTGGRCRYARIAVADPNQAVPRCSVMQLQLADKRVVGLLVACLAAVRFCHVGVLWVEEAYPMAAARAMLSGTDALS